MCTDPPSYQKIPVNGVMQATVQPTVYCPPTFQYVYPAANILLVQTQLHTGYRQPQIWYPAVSLSPRSNEFDKQYADLYPASISSSWEES